MKNKIQKLVLITLTMTGALSQIGCVATEEVCNPDGLDRIAMTSSKKFNNTDLGSTQDFGLTISTDFRNFVQDISNLTTEVESDDGVVTKIINGAFFVNNIEYPSYVLSSDFPLKKNETKTIHINPVIKSRYFEIKNLQNGKTSSLPPMDSWADYEGWESDASFRFHRQADGLNFLSHVEITDVENLVWGVTSEDTALESDVNDAETFPSLSPKGDLRLEMKEESKIWKGTATLKVIENANNRLSFEEKYRLTNGGDVFEQTSITEYQFNKEHCWTQIYE